jgi:hypothetical protein
MTRILDFARSTMTFRIDLDRIPPRTLSHRPPYPMNNARVVLDCRCRIADLVTGQVHTISLGASCKTERVGAESDLWLEPNGDFIPLFSDDEFMHIKTFARVGTVARLHPPGSGEQGDRLRVPIDGTFDRVHLDLVECVGERLDATAAIVDAVLANDRLVGIHRIVTDRYRVEIEYPVKTINANERDWVYQTDTGPILFPDLDVEPEQLLSGVNLAFTASNSPTWAEFIVRARTPIAEGVDVYHYSKAVRLDGIVNEVYRIRDDLPVETRRVDLPVRARSATGGPA